MVRLAWCCQDSGTNTSSIQPIFCKLLGRCPLRPHWQGSQAEASPSDSACPLGVSCVSGAQRRSLLLEEKRQDLEPHTQFVQSPRGGICTRQTDFYTFTIWSWKYFKPCLKHAAYFRGKKNRYFKLQSFESQAQYVWSNQCKIIHPVTLKMFGIKILSLLVLSLTSFMFHLKISPNCTEMADHAFTNNTLVLTIIQCKRVKHFLLYIYFSSRKTDVW